MALSLTISTWFCADEVGEESTYQQMRGKSSSHAFQAVYWRNIYLFFLSSRKMNSTSAHVLFTNTAVPVIDDVDLNEALRYLNVEIVQVPFTYKTPVGYYSAWRNQFYEFSILDYIASHYSEDRYWLILDSDCVFTNSVESMTSVCEEQGGVLTYKLTEKPGAIINGLTQQDMQELYAELLNVPIPVLPEYHAGEFFFANTAWVKRLSADFQILWPVLLQRHANGQSRLTEEAHVLSYLYYKHNVPPHGTANSYIKRLWTQPFIYRNVDSSDDQYAIWHLPHEKRYGLKNIFRQVIRQPLDYWLRMDQERFVTLLRYQLTIPSIHPFIYLTRLLPVQTARVIYYGAKRLVNR